MAEKFDPSAIKNNTNLVELVSRYTQLQKSGAEYKGLCIFHDDHNPSFYVNEVKNICGCFRCGEHYDAISFLMAAEQIEFPEACKRLLNGSGTGNSASLPNPKPVAQREYKKPPPRITTPPPDGTPPPNMAVKGLGGKPSATWEYRTPDGKPWGYVARYETKDGKTIRVWSWGSRGESDPPTWACGHFTAPRPMYGLEKLAKRPKAQILLCEGEKAADAAAILFPDLLAMTWPGGAQAVKYVDWSPLQGRECVLFPDNDAAGIDCMAAIAAALHNAGASKVKGIRVATQPDGSDTPDKWDIADADGWTPETALAWAKPRVFTYPTLPTQQTHQTDEISTPHAPDIPHDETPPFPPLEAYGEADIPPASEQSRVWVPTQPRPISQGIDLLPGHAVTPESLGVISRRMSDVTIKAIDWLWQGKIPCGKVTGISGNPGLGKSQITASLAAVVSVGGKWPVTREQAKIGSVLLLNAEDDADDTLAPRLIAAGADLDRIHIIDAIRTTDNAGETLNRGLDLVRDIERIGVVLNTIGDCRLVIIDPASAYMGTADSHKMSDVVGIMSRLKTLAARHGCAIIMVNHLNKSSGGDPLLKTQGSIGFVSHARAVWHVCKDKDDPQKRYFVPGKNNLGPDSAAASLSYRIEEFTLTDSDPLITTSRIMWDSDLVTTPAHELMSASDLQEDTTADCEQFLFDILQHGAVPVNEVQLAARKAGHLHGTLRRTKAKLRVIARKLPVVGGAWVWELPPSPLVSSYADRDK